MGALGAKALLAAVPLQRARGVKPLWMRVEWNQIDETELRRYIEQVHQALHSACISYKHVQLYAIICTIPCSARLADSTYYPPLIRCIPGVLNFSQHTSDPAGLCC
jgi:hypothetical protein